ncbi:MAG: hypothetical protein JNK72_18420 [Myxococcales bacterium]|nr:hypothetical protein [Myxococcales bacterium]
MSAPQLRAGAVVAALPWGAAFALGSWALAAAPGQIVASRFDLAVNLVVAGAWAGAGLTTRRALRLEDRDARDRRTLSGDSLTVDALAFVGRLGCDTLVFCAPFAPLGAVAAALDATPAAQLARLGLLCLATLSLSLGAAMQLGRTTHGAAAHTALGVALGCALSRTLWALAPTHWGVARCVAALVTETARWGVACGWLAAAGLALALSASWRLSSDTAAATRLHARVTALFLLPTAALAVCGATAASGPLSLAVSGRALVLGLGAVALTAGLATPHLGGAREAFTGTLRRIALWLTLSVLALAAMAFRAIEAASFDVGFASLVPPLMGAVTVAWSVGLLGLHHTLARRAGAPQSALRVLSLLAASAFIVPSLRSPWANVDRVLGSLSVTEAMAVIDRLGAYDRSLFALVAHGALAAPAVWGPLAGAVAVAAAGVVGLARGGEVSDAR